MEIEPRAAIGRRREEGEGIGPSQRGSGWGVIGKAGTQVRAQSGRSNGGELPTKGAIDSCWTPMGVPC